MLMTINSFCVQKGALKHDWTSWASATLDALIGVTLFVIGLLSATQPTHGLLMGLGTAYFLGTALLTIREVRVSKAYEDYYTNYTKRN